MFATRTASVIVLIYLGCDAGQALGRLETKRLIVNDANLCVCVDQANDCVRNN